MLIRKNISLDGVYLKKLQPLMDKNGGNLSAAIRDAINLTAVALETHDTLEKSIEVLGNHTLSSSKRDKLIEHGDNIIISQLSLQWLLENSRGRIVCEELISELINPFAVRTMEELDEYLNNLSQDFGWNIDILVFSPDPIEPETATVVFSNGDPHLRDFFAEQVALFLVQWKHLDIDSIYRRSRSLRIDFKSISTELDEIPPGIMKHFGYLDDMYRGIKDKPEFWSELVDIHKTATCKMVTVPQCQFDVFVAGETPDSVMIFESLSKRYIKDIPFHEFLVLFKKVHSVLQFVNNIEIQLEPGQETVKIQHDYRNEKTISKLIQYFSRALEANGHTFDVTHSGSLIIFKHRDKDSK